MSKPLSRSQELGRGIGYNIDREFLLEWLTKNPGSNSESISRDRLFRKSFSGKPKRLWLVVKNENKVPVMVDVYPDKRAANRRAEFLRKHMRAELDSISLIEFKPQSVDQRSSI
jgi:hypothetical protein